DLCLLIPEWRFFAPRPTQGDYHLLYRDEILGGDRTAWTEVVFGNNRRWWNILWNPDTRLRKALFDAVSHLVMHGKMGTTDIDISVPYVTLLTVVSSASRSSSLERTQFLIMESFGSCSERYPQAVFLSAWHSL